MTYDLHFEIPKIGPLCIGEVYQEYDNIPLLLSAFTTGGKKFLASALDDNEYLFVRFTDSMRSALLSKTIDINYAFVNSDSTCWKIALSENGITKACEQLDLNNVPKDYFPTPGNKLIGFESELTNKKLEIMQKDAITRNCDRISYHIDHKDGMSAIPVPLFIKITEFVNQTFKDLLYSKRLNSPATKDSDEDSYDIYDLQLLPVSPGSVEIDFATQHIQDILGANSYSDIVNKFIDIIDCDDQSLDAYKGISYDIVDRVRSFTKSMARYEFSTDVGIATIDGIRYNRVFKPSQLRKKSESLVVPKKFEINNVKKEGYFYAGNLKSRHFNFLEYGTGRVYSGKVDENIPRIQLSDIDLYIAEFEEMTVFNPLEHNKELTKNYKLLSATRKEPESFIQ